MSTSQLAWRQNNNPIPVYLVLIAAQAVCFSLFFTIQLIYQVTVIGLDPFQMVLVGVVLEVTCFVFEVPTGVVADVFSRRLSILIGLVLIGWSYSLEGWIPAFGAALVSQVFWGLGYTFTSGATEAWITDEIGEEAVGPVFLHGRQMWLVGSLIGTLGCVGLGIIHMQLPMILAGVGMFILAAAMVLVMPERHMRVIPASERSTFGQMAATARQGVRLAIERPVARAIIVISLIVGLASEAWDRLYVPSAIDRFAFPPLLGLEGPVVWFGLSSVIGMTLGLAVSEVVKRRFPALLADGAPARFLATCSAMQVAAIVIFALSGNLWLAFGMLWVRVVVNAVSQPVEAAWLNRNLESSTRATVISMTGQANSIGQAAGGPALGWIGNVASIQAALLGAAIVLSPTIALYRRMIARPRTANEPRPSFAD